MKHVKVIRGTRFELVVIVELPIGEDLPLDVEAIVYDIREALIKRPDAVTRPGRSRVSAF